MTIHICDRCLKTKAALFDVLVAHEGDRIMSFEVCSDCLTSFRLFMKPDKADKGEDE